jgi:hypothetical protein
VGRLSVIDWYWNCIVCAGGFADGEIAKVSKNFLWIAASPAVLKLKNEFNCGFPRTKEYDNGI